MEIQQYALITMSCVTFVSEYRCKTRQIVEAEGPKRDGDKNIDKYN